MLGIDMLEVLFRTHHTTLHDLASWCGGTYKLSSILYNIYV